MATNLIFDAANVELLKANVLLAKAAIFKGWVGATKREIFELNTISPTGESSILKVVYDGKYYIFQLENYFQKAYKPDRKKWVCREFDIQYGYFDDTLSEILCLMKA